MQRKIFKFESLIDFMKVILKHVLKGLLGWVLVVGGLILVPFPILPGWIFVFFGAFLLGWITKRQMMKIREELEKVTKLEKKLVKPLKKRK